MYLYSYRFNRIRIKCFIRINNSHRYNRASCFYRALKRTSFKLANLISLSGSGSFRENQIIMPVFYIFRYILYYFHRLTHILSVNRVSPHDTEHMLQEKHVNQFFFYDNGKEPGRTVYHGKYIIHSLMIGKIHKAAFFRNIFHTVGINRYIAAFIGVSNNFSKKREFFFIRKILTVFSIIPELPVPIRRK